MPKKNKTKEKLDSNIISDTVNTLLSPLEDRKPREKTKKELEEEEKKRELRKAAAGKVAGWGDYKFDWEK